MKADGVEGVFANGTSGESMSLSVEERMTLAEHWGAACKKHGLHLIVHIGAQSYVPPSPPSFFQNGGSHFRRPYFLALKTAKSWRLTPKLMEQMVSLAWRQSSLNPALWRP